MKNKTLSEWKFLRLQSIKREQAHRDMELDCALVPSERATHKIMADHYAKKRAYIDSEIRLIKNTLDKQSDKS